MISRTVPRFRPCRITWSAARPADALADFGNHANMAKLVGVGGVGIVGTQPPGSSDSSAGPDGAPPPSSYAAVVGKQGAELVLWRRPVRPRVDQPLGQHQHLAQRSPQAAFDDHRRFVIIDRVWDRHVGQQHRLIDDENRQCDRPFPWRAFGPSSPRRGLVASLVAVSSDSGVMSTRISSVLLLEGIRCLSRVRQNGPWNTTCPQMYLLGS